MGIPARKEDSRSIRLSGKWVTTIGYNHLLKVSGSPLFISEVQVLRIQCPYSSSFLDFFFPPCVLHILQVTDVLSLF